MGNPGSAPAYQPLHPLHPIPPHTPRHHAVAIWTASKTGNNAQSLATRVVSTYWNLFFTCPKFQTNILCPISSFGYQLFSNVQLVNHVYFVCNTRTRYNGNENMKKNALKSRVVKWNRKQPKKSALTIRISCIQVTDDRGKSRSKTETFAESENESLRCMGSCLYLRAAVHLWIHWMVAPYVALDLG